ncbi:hypothetical protein GCU67_20060 [Modestobacter muralis]|uniref:Uncharacterized protein n=1 Tax=Modestobacter muralis TaxID=1608614 RepID=A0A6P0HDN3_9ACTN|nr:hypothetical protein [Modestobacter muralis]NEK96443.1 hypothetical protein [Modestobacter muralis]NEN53343.1 hypothetical protein [Modestobacter muralis]
MTAALAGWLGACLFAAALLLTAVLEVRDAAGPGRSRSTRRALTLALCVLVAACAVATVVRFAVHLS